MTAAAHSPAVTIVIPTIGRPALALLLDSLLDSSRQTGLALPPVILVDDRRAPTDHLTTSGEIVAQRLSSGGRGPAAARNVGWRAAATEWIAFLDDDVRVTASWLAELAEDLEAASGAAGSQARIVVPLPTDRRPTDWERGTAGLAGASWITADMAYQRTALHRVGGFDERFPRAYREDADLALRLMDAGYRLVGGQRTTVHPVRPTDRWVSVRQQRGNADDVLMQRLHGPGWRHRADAPLGRRPAHVVTTAAGLIAVAALVGRRPWWAAAGLLTWLAATVQFSWRRLRPGPWSASEVGTMLLTSAAIPPAATWHWLTGLWRHRHIDRLPTDPPGRATSAHLQTASAVLVDRDGTLVHDVPYNGDPALVRPLPGAKHALDRLRAAGLPVAVISNQSGIARGLLTPEQVSAVNQRIEELLGPFDGWFVCPHGPSDACSCRKPMPGLVRQAGAALGVEPERIVIVGDIGADVECAAAAGAAGILVPTAVTRGEEIRAAEHCVLDLNAAAELIVPFTPRFSEGGGGR